jgi:hypothetical protein
MVMQTRMSGKKIAITQSNYIPWKGYFDSINMVDEFILYDDMQYTKRDWRNRNKIKTADDLQWLTIPVEVKGKFLQKIKEVQINDPEWAKNHFSVLKQNYSKCECWKETKDFVEELYVQATSNYLSKINYHFLNKICDYLDIKTPIRFSDEFDLIDGKTEKLVGICKQAHATDYYTGPAARNYMDESLFEKENIRVHYFDYSGYPEYPQLNPPFEHGVSVLDLILNTGNKAAQYLKSFNKSLTGTLDKNN